MKIKKIKKIKLDKLIPVYDIEVEKYHNFAIGREKNIVHNCEYLHGNLDGVIVNLGTDFSGTNNVPLLQKKGNFGTRFNQAASASRYIHTYGTSELFSLFKKEDSAILKEQYFEGVQIEPLFFVPSLPILLINGSEGVSSGFAQKILPRDLQKIKQYVKNKLSNKKSRKCLVPYFNGFNGIIEQGENKAQWIIKGCAKKIAINKVKITEVPIGYDLQGYLKTLDTLEDKGVIQSYLDKSEDDNFLFEVNIASKELKKWSEHDIYSKLKLIKKVTENYTVIDENNKIKVYTSVEEIINHYIKVKLDFTTKRKKHLIEKMKRDIDIMSSKYEFIKGIVTDKIFVNKKNRIQIEKQLHKFKNIIKIDDSYDYLLRLQIHSLTTEKYKELSQQIKNVKVKLNEIKKIKVEDMWLNDITELEKTLK